MNSFYKNLECIRESVSVASLWGQFAEEAAELAQVALKMQRACSDDNPPRCSIEEARASFLEELADLDLCLRALNLGPLPGKDQIMIKKAERWAGGIRARSRNE